MDFLQSIFQPVFDIGPVVFMPIVLFILALVFQVPLLKALKNAIVIGVGFVGIYLVLGWFLETIAPAASAMAERTGSNLKVIDVGWPATAAIAFSSPLTFLFIPVGIAVNLVMLLLKWTKTLDVNIWDYWHFIFAASIFYFVTGNVAISLGIAGVLFALILVMADVTQKDVAEFFNLPGISFPLAGNVEWWLVAKPINKLLDQIPFFKKSRFTAEFIKEKFGILGEPVVQGSILGVILGILAGYSWSAVLVLGFNMAAAVIILPRMVAILMEALVPISEAAGEFMKKHAGGRELYIGMDSAIGTGQSAVVANAILMVPITIVLALILPGNKVLPLADLSALVFPLMFAVVVAKGDMLRSILISIVFIIAGLYTASAFAPYITPAAAAANFEIPEGAAGITSLAQAGFEPYTVLLAKLLETLKNIGIL